MAKLFSRISAAAAALVAVLFGASGTACTDDNRPEHVYGPPAPDITEPDNGEFETVYGPPEWFEQKPVTPPSGTSGEDDPYAEIEDIYGPPPGE